MERNEEIGRKIDSGAQINSRPYKIVRVNKGSCGEKRSRGGRGSNLYP
ncbi:MAG: hypothetical protein U9Q66_02750 [Patescibacteria group bacterium]|nr:hypothetical protein [Patescibacteria group bacterium]